jgi:hypothetical protein
MTTQGQLYYYKWRSHDFRMRRVELPITFLKYLHIHHAFFYIEHAVQDTLVNPGLSSLMVLYCSVRLNKQSLLFFN